MRYILALTILFLAVSGWGGEYEYKCHENGVFYICCDENSMRVTNCTQLTKSAVEAIVKAWKEKNECKVKDGSVWKPIYCPDEQDKFNYEEKNKEITEKQEEENEQLRKELHKKMEELSREHEENNRQIREMILHSWERIAKEKNKLDTTKPIDIHYGVPDYDCEGEQASSIKNNIWTNKIKLHCKATQVTK